MVAFGSRAYLESPHRVPGPDLGPGQRGARGRTGGAAGWAGADLGQAAPTAEEFAARMADELAVSRAALVARTADYDAKRWGRTRLEKIADPLFEASLGYLDVLEALPAGRT